jgi:aryl-alcohol dehydrogenase-like predicted oxidoreductase
MDRAPKACEQLKCYEALCVELGATPTQVALA